MGIVCKGEKKWNGANRKAGVGKKTSQKPYYAKLAPFTMAKKFVTFQFPDELSTRLPPKRKPWKSEDSRMDIFDAVALAVVFRYFDSPQHVGL
jgi:hypothetical protein